uniref:Uncharacterized protein n=1 Tax=Buteo japonicus TaxID=224669 RepID=A0A8C0BZR4_9AVES
MPPCRGKPRQWRRLWATLCSAAASVLYAAAIVTYSQQPAHVLRALPWLLIALGSAALDVVVSFSSSSPRALSWHMEEDGARWASGLYQRSLMLGPPWLEMERKVTEEQWKKRFSFSLWLKSGKESCPAQQCYCSATPGEGGGMLGAGATQRRGQRPHRGGSACFRAWLALGTSPSPQDHTRFPAMLTWEQLGTGVQPLDAP